MSEQPEPVTTPSPLERPIRSFVLRTGRTTAGQARAFEAVGPQFLVPYKPERLDLEATFGRSAPTVF